MTKQKFSVLVCEPMAPLGLAMLKEHPDLVVHEAMNLSREDLFRRIVDANAVLVRSQTKLDRELIMSAPALKLIGRAGTGIDNIDVHAAFERGVTVINTPSGNSISAAELAFALMLTIARKIPAANASLKNGIWDRKRLQGNELHGKTLGILGFGNVGQNLARRAQAFDMKVVAHDPWADSSAFSSHNVESLPLDDMLRAADFVSLHCALSDDSKNIINETTLRHMKPGAALINTARGELVDDAALIKALDAGHLKEAALDVFRKEPPDANDPLLLHPKIIVTPHLGASTEEAQLRVSTLLAEQTIAFFSRAP